MSRSKLEYSILLNEFFLLAQGMSAAGLDFQAPHPDVQHPRKTEALLIRLGEQGEVLGIELLDADVVAQLWTMRKGNHNSFPFMQIPHPILTIPKPDRPDHAKMAPAAARNAMHDVTERFQPGTWADSWPGEGLKSNLRQRRTLVAQLEGSESAAVPAAIDRFLAACEASRAWFCSLVNVLLDEVNEGDGKLLAAAWRILVEEGGALYVDVARGDFARGVADKRHSGPVSRALDGDRTNAVAVGLCAITGEQSKLLAENYPQPSLGPLGPTYLFAKNPDIMAAHRYGRSAAEAFPISLSLTQRLGGAVAELTARAREGKTWRMIPGERPKQNDLMLAFAEAVPDAEIAAMLGGGHEQTDDADGEAVEPGAVFEKRTGQVIEAVRAKVRQDFREAPVQLCILRKVDPANKKVIYHREITVGRLYDVARRWIEGERNLPPWLRLPVPGKRGSKAPWHRPSHVAPLQMPALTRSRYIRGGSERTEAVGLSAREVFSLFLEDRDYQHQALAVLRSILQGYSPLLLGCAQALRKGGDKAQTFKRDSALHGLTLIGVLLHKVGRQGGYMEDTAFRLGQLLAVADTVHVGYCMDRRNGGVPPTLLGNAVFTMAQKDPIRALALLGRRWKPYGAWAKQPNDMSVEKPPAAPEEADKYWAIRRALSQAHRAEELTRELHGHLPSETSDLFRAELLLGYVAGLPPRRESSDDADEKAKEAK